MHYSLRQGHFGLQEAVSLGCVLVTSRLLFLRDGYAAQSYMVNAVLAPLGSAVIGVCVLLLGLYAMGRTDQPDLIQAFESALGKPLGRACSMLLVVALLHFSSAGMADVVAMLKEYVFSRASHELLLCALCACALPLVLFGFESIARSAKFLIFVFLAVFIIMVLLAPGNTDSTRLYPLWGSGSEAVSRSLRHSSLFLSLACMLALGGSLHSRRNVKKTLLISSGISLALGLIYLLIRSLMISQALSDSLHLGLYDMLSMLSAGRLLQRLDTAFVFTFMMGHLIATAFMLYTSANIYCRCFSMRDTRPVSPIIVLFTGLWALLMLQKYSWAESAGTFMDTYGAAFFALPIVLSAVAARLRRKRVGAQ